MLISRYFFGCGLLKIALPQWKSTIIDEASSRQNQGVIQP